MEIVTFMLLGFLWTLIVFSLGVAVHWLATKKQRSLLRRYRAREQARRQMSQPVE